VAELQEFTTALNKALMDMVSTLQTLGAAMLKEPNRALANASVFLEAFGHTVIAWMWLRQAVAACRALALDATVLDATEQAFYQGKLNSISISIRHVVASPCRARALPAASRLMSHRSGNGISPCLRHSRGLWLLQ
jgi:hypothetical protein